MATEYENYLKSDAYKRYMQKEKGKANNQISQSKQIAPTKKKKKKEKANAWEKFEVLDKYAQQGLTQALEGITDVGGDALEFVGKKTGLEGVEKAGKKLKKKARNSTKYFEDTAAESTSDGKDYGIAGNRYVQQAASSFGNQVPGMAMGLLGGYIGEAGAAKKGLDALQTADKIEKASRLASLTTLGLGSAGQSSRQLQEEGYSLEKAILVGGLKGGIEVGTELLGDKVTGGVNGLSFGKGAGGDLGQNVANKLTKNMQSKFKRAITNFMIREGFEVTGEIGEEVVGNIANNILDRYALEKDNKIWDNQEMLDTVVTTAISTLGMNFATGGFVTTGHSVANDMKMQDLTKAATTTTEKTLGRKLTKAEQTNVENQVQYQKSKNGNVNNELIAKTIGYENEVVKTIFDERVAEAKKDGKKLSAQELTDIENQVKEDVKNGAIEPSKLESIIAGEENSKIGEEAVKLSKEIDALESKENRTDAENKQLDKLNDEFKHYLEDNREAIDSVSNIAHEIRDSGSMLGNSYAEQYNKGISYQKSENVSQKQQTLEQDMINLGKDNSRASHEIVQNYTTLSEDLGFTGRLMNTDSEVYQNHIQQIKDGIKTQLAKENAEFNNYSENVQKQLIDEKYNSMYGDSMFGGWVDKTTNEMYINLDSKEAVNFLLGHETGHILKGSKSYDALTQALEKYAESKGTLQDMKDSIESRYGTLDQEELNSDLIGRYVFNDQDFLNSLAVDNRTTFDKLHDMVNRLVDKITGNNSEAAQIRDIQAKFRKAYEYAKNKGVRNIDGNEIKHQLSDNALQEVADVVSQTKEEAESSNTQFVKLKDNTIDILLKNGAKDLPMLERVGHVRENVLTKEQAQKLGYSIKNKHYHGLGVKTYLEIIDSIDNSTKLYQYTNNKEHYITIAPIKLNGNEVIVPVEINKNGRYNDVNIDLNKIMTVFENETGDYIQDLINKGKIKEIVIGDKNRQVSLDANNITPTKENVKSGTRDSSFFNRNNLEEELRDKASKIEFRQRDDGYNYVQILDDYNNIIYDGTFINEKSMSKTLGEDIAKYIIDNSVVGEYNEIKLSGETQQNETDYFMNHRPTETKGYGYDLLNSEFAPNDIYEHPEYYATANKKTVNEIMDQLNSVRNNPKGLVTIYRATTGNKINSGDWVTLSKSYAEQHNQSQFDGKGNVLEMKVPAKDIQWAGDDLNEFGYFPQNNTKYSLTQDSDGNELTKGQQDYFKNSKALDSRGNLQVVYHGTTQDFTIFEDGIFLTDDYMNADGYASGERVIESYVNIEKPLVLDCKGRKWDNLDFELGTSTREVVANFDRNKYDGVIFENINDSWIDDEEAGDIGTVYYVDNSNQVKDIYNENPTSNPDIRYSIEGKRVSDTGVTGKDLNVDNKGKKLSKGLQEWSKNSAIRVSLNENGYPVIDPNGRLFEVYHGTNSDSFTEFDSRYIGASNDAGWYGRGFYFAFSEAEAKSYGSNVIKAYLNITNPFNFTDEMQMFRGKYTNNVAEDFGAFMINLSDKFTEIADNNTIGYTDWEYNEDGSQDVKYMPISQLAKEIENVYDSPKLRIIEVSDMGQTKYQYIYNDDVRTAPMSEDMRQLILDSHILNKNDIDFAVKERKYYPNLTDEQINKLYDFYNETGYNFQTDTIGWTANTREELENGRLGYATEVVISKLHNYVDRHMPEVYMESFGVEISDKLKEMGYDGVIQSSSGDEIVAFYPNQIKSVDNQNPTISNDIYHSIEEEKVSENGTTGNELNVAKEQSLSDMLNETLEERKIAPLKENKQSSKEERSWIETATESESVKGKLFPEDVEDSIRYYQPISNEKTLNFVNKRLDTNGYENSLQDFKSKIRSGEQTNLNDIAMGERLLQEALARGDNQTASELLQDISILGTELGRQVQALSMIQRMTPEGQLSMLQKTVDRAKMKGDTTFDNVKITQDMIDRILNTYKEDGSFDQNDLNQAVEDVKQEIADQMNTTIGEKINAWRYLSMLGNPKTHIRNIVSNGAMKATEGVKNAVARTIQDIAPIKGKTRTWKQATPEIKQYANQVTEEMKSVISGESKYSEKTSIKAKRQTFKTQVLEKAYNLNSNLLEAEDWFFSKASFKSNFQEFLAANNIRTQADIEANPQLIEKAKLYAVEQAQISTFRQYSALANVLNNISNKSKAGKFIVEATMPFKKTPINIAKTAIEYSPIGFVNAINQVRTGVEASTIIDTFSKGLTGSSLIILGYMLSKMGVLNGAGNGDKEDKYDYQLGKQTYSINVGDKTISLSWLSPVAMPLFVGVNAQEIFEEDMELTPDVVTEALLSTIDPLNEMSVMSGVTSTLQSYSNGTGSLGDMGKNMLQSYIMQFIPTFSSQIAATLDTKKRVTKASSDSGFKFLDETVRKAMYKIPGLRNLLEPSLDIWGNEVKQSDNVAVRAFENFIAPYSSRDDITSDVDREIKKVYGITGETGVLPNVPTSSVKFKDEQYKMSSKEYTEFKKQYGETAYKTLEKLMKNSSYKNADADTKAKMIDKVFDYASDESKKTYLKGKGIYYTNAKEKNVDVYKTDPIKGAIDRNLTLEEFNYYRTSPKSYSLYKSTGMKFNDYRTIQSELNEIKSDKDESGNTISGSRKQKVLEYINSLNVDYYTKLLLYKNEYNSDTYYDDAIVQYIINSQLSREDKVQALEQLGFKVK